MASREESMQYVVDQLARLDGITTRKMFGEYAIYLDGTVIGLVADDQFFVKPTAAGEALLDKPQYSPPYPGAKPHLLMTEDLDNSELLCRLVQATANALPMPKPKSRLNPKVVKDSSAKAGKVSNKAVTKKPVTKKPVTKKPVTKKAVTKKAMATNRTAERSANSAAKAATVTRARRRPVAKKS